MKQCIESNRRWWIFIRKKNPIFDFCLLRVSVFLYILVRTQNGQKTSEEKSRSDLNVFLFILRFMLLEREENQSRRQKKNSKQLHRAGKGENKVRKEAFLYFFSCFAFACACCVKRAITRRKEKNEISRKKCGWRRERRLYGNCVTFYGIALDLSSHCWLKLVL